MALLNHDFILKRGFFFHVTGIMRQWWIKGLALHVVFSGSIGRPAKSSDRAEDLLLFFKSSAFPIYFDNLLLSKRKK